MRKPRIIRLSDTRSGTVRFLSGLHVTLEEGKTTSWVTVTRTGVFRDPRYGEFEISRQMLGQMVENFNARAFGQDIFYDVAHKPADGAAGKVLQLKLEGDRLRAQVEWTPYGIDAITSKGYAYSSIKYHDNYQDNETGRKYGPVMMGAALVTRPCVKRLDPIQLIDGNTFNGGTGGGAGAAISWWPQSTNTTYHENLKITNNTFNGCSAAQGVIVLLATTTSASTVHIYDLEVSGNTFTNCGGTAIKAYVPLTGQNKGAKVFGNTITNQGRVGDLGGGIVLGGFTQTTTANFGQNVVEHNYADGLQGTTGFANIMYGSYIIRHNVAKNISSVIYDGCGLLFDHSADGCTAYGNYFENLSGPADFTAGAGIGIIFEATNITCYGNVIKNCYMGVFYGNQTSGRVSNIYNNTFIDCVLAGIHGNARSRPNTASAR